MCPMGDGGNECGDQGGGAEEAEFDQGEARGGRLGAGQLVTAPREAAPDCRSSRRQQGHCCIWSPKADVD